MAKDVPVYLSADVINESEDFDPKSPSNDPDKTWEELIDIVESGELHLLRRRPEDQVCYERRREEIITEYGSMTQYVVTQLLKWEDLIDPTTKYTKMVDSLASFDPSLAKLLPNDFPYAIDAAVSHYVLWYKAPLQRTSALDGFLKEQFPGHDILFFVNPPHLQSIRTIHHGHVFVRRQS